MNTTLRFSFWSSNICFLAIAYLGILPFLGKDFFPDLIAGQLPLDLFLTFLALIVIPTVIILQRFWRFSPSENYYTYDERENAIINARNYHIYDQRENAHNDYKANFSLAKLFFGIEAPLLILCIARLFWLKELTPATTLIICTGLLAVLSFVYELFRDSYSQTLNFIQMVGHSLVLLIGTYIGAIALLYLPPLIFIIGFSFIYGLVFIPLILVAIALVALCSLPYGMAICCIQAWWGFSSKFTAVYGSTKTRLITGTTIAAWFIILAIAQVQPQNQAFTLLENPTANRPELLQKSDQIRSGLVNAYLARYRYPNFDQKNRIITDFYSFVGFPRSLSDRFQAMHDFLTSPFNYNGSTDDSKKAESLYATFFDQPILRGEQQAIQQAVNNTFIRSDAKAGLLSVNQRKVLLSTQELLIKPHGDWADVEIHEIYQNQTSDQQEIFYAFNLPESAVLTGVWLGDTNVRSQAFPFTVSTRGAAQAVYNAEVQRRVDPALLEQVGTRSYRLRVFPIPPNSDRRTSSAMNMWMSYKVMGTKAGWALPQLAEKRNLFWTKATDRIYNGKTSTGDTWFPDFMAADQPIQAQSHQINFTTGDRIIAKPIQAQTDQFSQKFAIVLDGSYSMNAHRSEVESTLAALRTQKHDFDVYVSASQGGQPQKINGLGNFKLSDVTFYGLLRPQEILQQFVNLNSSEYAAVLMITDQGNYELTDENAKVAKISSPLWMVHLGGLPAAYDDATLEAIQTSGGGVSTSVQDVLQRLATQTELRKLGDRSLKNVVDGYAWYQDQQESKEDSRSTPKDDFLPLAARQLIQTYAQTLGQNVEDQSRLRKLDAIHNLAKRYSIVTPYSSMIVLVNDAQREALKSAETKSDRFNRTTEDNQLPTPTSVIPTLSGVPEPSEWLLIGVVIFALGWLGIKQMQQLELNPDE